MFLSYARHASQSRGKNYIDTTIICDKQLLCLRGYSWRNLAIIRESGKDSKNAGIESLYNNNVRARRFTIIVNPIIKFMAAW